MSFLDSNNSEFLSARITQKGRNSIAKGNFNIEYFQIGDSEFDYNLIYSGLTGKQLHQKVLSPFDKETSIKYPYKIDSSTSGTTYGTPIQQSTTYTIRNVMGPAGYISEYNEFESCSDPTVKSTTIQCETQTVSITSLTGGTSIQVVSGSSFNNCEYITVVFDQFCDIPPIVTGNSNSLIYRIESISGNTLNLDRPTPNFTGLTGNINVICNKCELEYPNEVLGECLPSPIDSMDQQNAWTLNVVWGQKPTGADVNGTNEGLSGYTSNRFVSTKEFLGYTSTGQTFENLTGGTITPFSSKNIGTGFLNSFNELVEVSPKEQRCVAIIHYSELGDLINNPERFYKYDDYISYKTGITGQDIAIAFDRDPDEPQPISDTEYFEIYIPFIYYHRNTGTTYGALFYMDTTDYFVRSTKNDRHDLLFRYLIDEQGNKVGKVFPKNKIVVFDDQELVAILDYRSNRKFTLGAPRINAAPSNETPSNSLISGTTGQTYYVTYMLSETNGTASPLNTLPCNYYVKITTDSDGDGDACTTINYPSNINVKFNNGTFNFFTADGFLTQFKPKRFFILVQDTTDNTDRLPNPLEWKIIDFTTQAGGTSLSGLTSTTFTITKSLFDSASFFDLETYMGSNYLQIDPSSDSQFGDEQPFPGSIRLVRASDVEQMNFLVNLPSTQFTTTQNPTYVSGKKYITEITLLDSNKDVLVKSKSAIPVERTGTQVFSIRLDF